MGVVEIVLVGAGTGVEVEVGAGTGEIIAGMIFICC